MGLKGTQFIRQVFLEHLLCARHNAGYMVISELAWLWPQRIQAWRSDTTVLWELRIEASLPGFPPTVYSDLRGIPLTRNTHSLSLSLPGLLQPFCLSLAQPGSSWKMSKAITAK